MQNWQFSRTGFAHFGATPASDRFDRERAARGIDFDAVGKARLIEALDDSDDVERTTADWFSDETQTAMQALVDSLKK